MSKVIYLTLRERSLTSKEYLEKIKEIANIIPPDNITPNPARYIEKNGVIGCIINPVDSIRVKEQSICLGAMMPETINWHIPKNEIPNGCFALFRSNDRFVEIASDFQATRTIWYIKTHEMFMASSSQRAIIMLLRSFHLDDNAVAWMLSSGTLGPCYSWDTRIKCLKPDSKILLDREKWEEKITEGEVVFNNKIENLNILKNQYLEVVKSNFKNMDIDAPKWFLPLTGGKDSRLMLSILNDIGKNLYCVTWGLKESLNMEGSDADIASKLAEYFNLNWKYYYTDYEGRENVDRILLRYINCSEGRLDNIEAFSDGFGVWKRLFNKGLEVGIGGTNGFGHKKSENSAFHIRKRKRVTVLRDYYNIPKNISEYYNQGLENYLNKARSESYVQYYHRMHQQFFIPFADSALNEAKCSYLEVINPMESRNIISIMRTIPDKLSKEKIFPWEIVKSVAPEVGLNAMLSVKKTESTIRDRRFNSEIKNVLSGHSKIELFPKDFLTFILTNMDQKKRKIDPYNAREKNIYNYLRSLLPLGLKNKIKSIFIKKIKIDINLVALRAYIIIKMNEILNKDAKYFQK